MRLTAQHRAYWRSNLLLTFSLLSVWFLVSFVAGFYADELNHLSFLGFPLGFYIFAQGSQITFIILIAIYVVAMNHLDRKYQIGEKR